MACVAGNVTGKYIILYAHLKIANNESQLQIGKWDRKISQEATAGVQARNRNLEKSTENAISG